jgi:hypothetical protein
MKMLHYWRKKKKLKNFKTRDHDPSLRCWDRVLNKYNLIERQRWVNRSWAQVNDLLLVTSLWLELVRSHSNLVVGDGTDRYELTYNIDPSQTAVLYNSSNENNNNTRWMVIVFTGIIRNNLTHTLFLIYTNTHTHTYEHISTFVIVRILLRYRNDRSRILVFYYVLRAWFIGFFKLNSAVCCTWILCMYLYTLFIIRPVAERKNFRRHKSVSVHACY